MLTPLFGASGNIVEDFSFADLNAEFEHQFSPSLKDERTYFLHASYIAVFPSCAAKKIRIEIDRVRERLRMGFGESESEAERTFQIGQFARANDPKQKLDDARSGYRAIQMCVLDIFESSDAEVAERLLAIDDFSRAPISTMLYWDLCCWCLLISCLAESTAATRRMLEIEPNLIAIMIRYGKSPIDFFDDDVSLQHRWYQEASGPIGIETPAENSFDLPPYIQCSTEEWDSLMRSLRIDFDAASGHYLWNDTQRAARFFLDLLRQHRIWNHRMFPVRAFRTLWQFL